MDPDSALHHVQRPSLILLGDGTVIRLNEKKSYLSETRHEVFTGEMKCLRFALKSSDKVVGEKG